MPRIEFTLKSFNKIFIQRTLQADVCQKCHQQFHIYETGGYQYPSNFVRNVAKQENIIYEIRVKLDNLNVEIEPCENVKCICCGSLICNTSEELKDEVDKFERLDSIIEWRKRPVEDMEVG